MFMNLLFVQDTDIAATTNSVSSSFLFFLWQKNQHFLVSAVDMDMESSRFNSPLLTKQEDSENSPENSGDSPRASMFNDSKTASTSSPKRSRRTIQKRVVSVPIKDVDGSRLKGEISTPPSDSWAWRKYGQKPIKGSPYPRGYYRCSSSKGCPARKQVERNRDEPNMLVVTYSCEHNHPWPATRNNHHNHNRNNNVTSSTTVTTSAITTTTTTTTNVTTSKSEEDNVANLSSQQEENSEEKFSNLGEASLVSGTHEFGWLSDFECTTSTMLESPILAEDRVTDIAEMNMFCSMREEDESLFADLGELPECSLVFRHGMIERDEESRRHGLTPWCGTTS